MNIADYIGCYIGMDKPDMQEPDEKSMTITGTAKLGINTRTGTGMLIVDGAPMALTGINRISVCRIPSERPDDRANHPFVKGVGFFSDQGEKYIECDMLLHVHENGATFS